MNRVRVLRLAVVFCAVVVSLSAGSPLWATGGDMGVGTDPLTDGSEAHPWLIEDFADFGVFANNANAAIYWAAGVHTRLECDLDLAPALPGRQIYTTAVIAPGTYESSDNQNPGYGSRFNGTHYAGFFDGGGHVIRNLTIEGSNADNDYIGLFGGVGGNARISHLRLENIAAITGGVDSVMVGGLCGEIFYQGTNYVTLTDCHVDGSIQTGDDSRYVGGLCGQNLYCIITDCSAAMNITGGVSCQSLGGLCGDNAGCLMNSQASGMITGSNSCYGLGGLCGTDDFTTYWRRTPYDLLPMPPITCSIDHCFATGAVSSGSSSCCVGGLIGSGVIILNSYATGTVSSGFSSYSVGGLIGSGVKILNSYATGTVTANPGSFATGGLCGSSNNIITGSFATGNVSGYEIVGGLCGVGGNVSNSYATGNVSGYKKVGGLCGLNGKCGLVWLVSNKIISNCYATGVVTGGQNIGGLCGLQSDSTAEINNSFWDTETSGTTVGYNLDVAHPGTINNVVGKTTAEMQTLSTFTDAGWDFDAGDGDEADWWMPLADYPKLSMQHGIIGFYGQPFLYLKVNQSGQIALDVFSSVEGHSISWTIRGYEATDWITSVSPVSGASNGPSDRTTVILNIDSNGLHGDYYSCFLEITELSGEGFILPVSLFITLHGEGTESNPYQINDIYDFFLFADPANSEIYWSTGVHTQLKCNLDLDPALPDRQIYASALLAPDTDNVTDWHQGNTYDGNFDGGGHRIVNLAIDTAGAGMDYLGLFGFLDQNATVKNLGMEEVSIIGGNESLAVGSLCGINYGHISSCYVRGAIVGMDLVTNVGGLCGVNRETGHVTDCYTVVNLVSGAESLNVGGLCGKIYAATIINSYAAGTISVGTGSDYVGGFCGLNDNGAFAGTFWDTTISGIADPETGIDTDGMIGLTTAEMQTLSTFTDAGWDFSSSDSDPAEWKMREKPYYPILAWQRDVYGDVAFDGVVNLADVALMAGQWMLTSADAGYLERCDLLDDDVIDGGDLAVLAEFWLYPEIAGDFNDEGGVNLADFAMMSAAWQAVPSDAYYRPACNLDDAGASEGIIDLADLAIFCEHWLEN